MTTITRLRMIRENRGESRPQVAAASGLSEHTIGRAERGQPISALSVKLLARAYSMKPPEIRAAMRDVVADLDPEPVPAPKVAPEPEPEPEPAAPPAVEPSGNETGPAYEVTKVTVERLPDPAPLPPDTGPTVTIPGRVYRETIRTLRRVEKLLELQDEAGAIKNGAEPRWCPLTTAVQNVTYQLRSSRIDLPETAE